jgi:LysM repeat protein
MKKRLTLLAALTIAILGAVIVATPPDRKASTDGEEAAAGEPSEGAATPAAPGTEHDPPVEIPGGGQQGPHASPVGDGETEEAPAIPEPASLEMAETLFATRKTESWFEARRMYSDLLVRGELTADHRTSVLERLTVINDRLFFSPEPSPDATFYTVQPGDTLSGIARAQEQTIGVIMAANFLQDPNRIRIGQRLKIIDGTISITVDRTNLRLAVLCGGAYIREYPIGIGSFGRTPEGEFEIETCLVEPDWYTPDGGVIRYGEPGHAIGTRWLGLKATREHQGYGIHGTDDPSSVPGRTSAGCIRLLNEHVEELYPLVSVGTRVVIS